MNLWAERMLRLELAGSRTGGGGGGERRFMDGVKSGGKRKEDAKDGVPSRHTIGCGLP